MLKPHEMVGFLKVSPPPPRAVNEGPRKNVIKEGYFFALPDC